MRGARTIWRLWCLMVSREVNARVLIALCFGLELAGVGLATAGPYLLKVLIDGLSGTRHGVRDEWLAVVGFVLSWTGATFATTWRSGYSTQINGSIAQRLISRAIRGFLVGKGEEAQAPGSAVGSLERVNYSIALVMEGLVWRIPPLLLQFGLTLVVIVQFMSWRYLVVLSCLAVAFVGASWYGARQQSTMARRVTAASAENAALIGDILSNAERVVSNGAVEAEVAIANSTLTYRYETERASVWTLVRSSGFQFAATAVGMCVLLILGCADVGRHVLTPGDFVLLQAYGLRLVMPLAAVGIVLNQSATALANIDDVFAMQAAPGRAQTKTELESFRRGAEVVADHISFSYVPGQPVLRDVTLEFPPGSFSVIVGKNGSGKSTLARVIGGQLAASSGAVRVGGVDISAIPAGERHRFVLYVPQRISLLNRSLRANLLYPPYSTTEESALQFLKDWDFYESGETVDLNAKAGERGARMSGGQAQKLELARLTGISVPCLVLDESTSAMDPASEQKAINGLRNALGDRTTLIFITHHEAIAEQADQVVWVVEGQVAAVGGHSELRRAEGRYDALWSAPRE